MSDLNSFTPAAAEPPPGWIDARHDALLAAISATRSDTFRLRRVRAAATVSALVFAAMLTVAIVVGGSDQPQLASWTATPQPVSKDQTDGLVVTCRSRLAKVPFADPAGLVPIVAERRGQILAVLMSGPGGYGLCVGSDRSYLAGVIQPGPDTEAAVVLDGDPGVMNGPGAVRVAIGRTAGTVARVVIATSDGRQVTASLAGNQYFAWWPSGADPVLITGYDAAGSVVGVHHPQPHAAVPTPTHS